MKIRFYLALMVTAILVPVIVFSATALNMLLRAERDAALRGVQETARATAVAIDRELDSAQTALRVLGISRNVDSADWEAFYRQAAAAQADKGSWTVLLTADGLPVVNTALPFGAPLQPEPHGWQLRPRLKEDEPAVSDLLQGLPGKDRMIAVAMPVALEGERRYVLAQMFRADYFDRAFARQTAARPNWITGIFDRQGISIARSHNAAEYVGKPVRSEITDAARTAREGVVRNRTRDGIEIYTAFTRSTLSGWGVAVGVPVEEIESAARRAVTVASLGLLAAFACAGGMGLFFVRRLSRSMAGAVQSAFALGRGETPAPARTGVAEVDELHSALAEAGAVLRRERESRALAESERTRLLASEQEARQIAEEQNKAKDEFLAMLGHELRNPLNAITAAISVIEIDGVDAEKAGRARAILRRQSHHLGRIVDDLLDLSRVMSGKIFLAQKPMDLAEMARESITTLSASGAARQHVVNLHTEAAWVNADPTRLEQIISNLLVNAFKYTPAGGRVDIDVRPLAGEAVFTVSDSGIGMSNELIPKVFDVFVQGPAQLDRSQGGLGIGLSLVRRLVELHGGTVAARSEGIGQGSAFTVRLPLAEAPVTAKDSAAEATSAAQKECRILLIDDNEDSRQTLSAVLALHGFQVREASDGADGIRVALEEQPDVAVIDIGLPGIDGYEVARRLRASPDGQHIGLIALTGYGQAKDKERALKAGFDLHLSKPVDTGRLIHAIAGAHLS